MSDEKQDLGATPTGRQRETHVAVAFCIWCGSPDASCNHAAYHWAYDNPLQPVNDLGLIRDQVGGA